MMTRCAKGKIKPDSIYAASRWNRRAAKKAAFLTLFILFLSWEVARAGDRPVLSSQPGGLSATPISHTPDMEGTRRLKGSERQKTRGYKAGLGIVVRDLKGVGVIVKEVLRGSPAEKAGMKKGDLILKYRDGEVKSASDLGDLVSSTRVGEEVEVQLFREGKVLNLTVVLGEVPHRKEARSKRAGKSLPSREKPSVKPSQPQVSRLEPGQVRRSPTEKFIRFRIPLLTEHYFLAGGGMGTGAWSFGFNYPRNWRLTTQPPGLKGMLSGFMAQRVLQQGMLIMISPDARGITHGSLYNAPVQVGVVPIGRAINQYVSRKFTNFRVIGRMETPATSVYGTRSQTVNIFYQAFYQGVPVKGLLGVGATSIADPMMGSKTILSFGENQIATSSRLQEYLENLNTLLAIRTRYVRDEGSREVTQGWINTLGGISEARDPNTGETFTVSSRFKYAWRDGNEILQTNDPRFKRGTLMDVRTAQPR